MLILMHSRKSFGNPRKATNMPIHHLSHCTNKAANKNMRAPFGSQPSLAVSLAIIVGCSVLNESSAQQILYDNTEFRLDFSERLYMDERTVGGFVAQPFVMGENGSIGNIRVGFARSHGDSGGIIPVSIWSDNGTGKPDEFVVDVGSIDFHTLPRFSGFPPTMPTSDFDTRIVGLTPGATYYVHFDIADVDLGPGPEFGNNHLIHGARRESDGTNGAGCVQIRHDTVVPEWSTIDEVFLPGRCYFQLAIESLSAAEIGFLHAGDADQDFDFDQIDLVQVQVAAKYLTGQAATWGEGDWNGAPGGGPGTAPVGDGLFNQLDIVAALGSGTYLTGPYAAIQPTGQLGDGQTSVIYNPGTGEISVDAPAGVELTSINIDSAAGIFTGNSAANLGGSFDNDADANIFKATFGGSFGSVSFGNVAQAGLSEQFVLGDLSVVGSLAGGGDLGNVDLVYVPEPAAIGLLMLGLLVNLPRLRQTP